MSTQEPNVLALQTEQNQLRFEIRTLEHDIERIQRQLDDAEGTQRENSDWWFRAKDALRHKMRDRNIRQARIQRIVRKLSNVKPEARREEAKGQLREVLRVLFQVARTSLDFYENDKEVTEVAFTEALDQLDQIVPDWDKPQAQEPKPLLQTLGLGD